MAFAVSWNQKLLQNARFCSQVVVEVAQGPAAVVRESVVVRGALEIVQNVMSNAQNPDRLHQGMRIADDADVDPKRRMVLLTERKSEDRLIFYNVVGSIPPNLIFALGCRCNQLSTCHRSYERSALRAIASLFSNTSHHILHHCTLHQGTTVSTISAKGMTLHRLFSSMQLYLTA